MSKPRLWRRAALLLIFGLELPALVLLGLYFSSELTTGWGEPWRTILVLVSSLGGYAAGALTMWWVALWIYRRQMNST